MDYVYDDFGRLEEVKKDNVVGSYEYDANGNRTLETNTARGITAKVYDYSNEDHIITGGALGSDQAKCCCRRRRLLKCGYLWL